MYNSLTLTVSATFTALKLQKSFCQDAWQNVGERPGYVQFLDSVGLGRYAMKHRVAVVDPEQDKATC